MANSSGLSRDLSARSGRSGVTAWRRGWFLGLLLMVNSGYAEMPGYLREALARFSPEVPREWAYTVTTEKDGRRTTERFDASRPPEEQWRLLLIEDRPPTPEELAKYFKYKAGQAPGATQATFQKGDIEPGRTELVSENAERAEFTCAFREESTNSDKMLGHLRLRLTVAKQQPHIEKFSLELREPYSPVLGVKMRELLVEMNFSPPDADHPGLPARSSSHFLGRIFLVPVEENLRYTYSDFTRVP
jgi:hypothetical protein